MNLIKSVFVNIFWNKFSKQKPKHTQYNIHTALMHFPNKRKKQDFSVDILQYVYKWNTCVCNPNKLC